jgi:hypothetical protein
MLKTGFAQGQRIAKQRGNNSTNGAIVRLSGLL